MKVNDGADRVDAAEWNLVESATTSAGTDPDWILALEGGAGPRDDGLRILSRSELKDACEGVPVTDAVVVKSSWKRGGSCEIPLPPSLETRTKYPYRTTVVLEKSCKESGRKESMVLTIEELARKLGAGN